MTVEDLLRHTSGLVYFDQGNTAVHKLYRESGLYATGLARDGTSKDFVSRLARLPLAHQPGQVWEYGHSADVLGRVIEVVSGQPLDQFLDNRLFKPLGMVDTGFWVPPEKLARLVAPPRGAQKPLLPDRDVAKPTTLFSGGGGLVSTAADYLRFCQMLLNGGEFDVRKGQDAPIELMIARAPIRAAGAGADLHVTATKGRLQIEVSGVLPVLDFEKGAPVTVVPMSSNEFFVDAGDHTRMAFSHDGAGKATSLALNPGPWQITGHRIN
jgi:CubicO group peptidase (beta-lactamase class C family)